jgi:hypothetical protein
MDLNGSRQPIDGNFSLKLRQGFPDQPPTGNKRDRRHNDDQYKETDNYFLSAR